jgi:hypothetical protein
MGRGPGISDDVWQRCTNVGFSAQVCVEAMLRNSVYSCLYLKPAKTLSLLIICYVFSSTKLEKKMEEIFCLDAEW